MPPANDPVELVKQVNENIKAMQENSTKIQAELKAALETTGKDATEALKVANEMATKIQGQAATLLEIEQKLTDSVIKGKVSHQTLGAMVIASDEYKQYALGKTRSLRIEANTIIGQEGSPAENSSTIVAPDRLPGIIPGAFRLLRVQDILPQGTTGSNLVEYTRELAFTNNAAETAEGASKPQSDLTFELVSAPVRTIAHFIKASNQVLSDAPQLASYIDTRMRYGVDYRFDSQLINGDGVGQNMSGMIDSGNFTAFTPHTGETALDSLNRAIYEIYASDYAPTHIVLNPADWGAIERLKVGGSADTQYVVGNPTGVLGPQLWGLPVVLTNALASGKFIVGSMPIAYQVWSRQGTVVEVFAQDDVNVQKNLVTIRAERRGMLATYRPASVKSGNLTL